MDRDDFADSSRRLSAGIDGGANGRHVAAQGDGHQAAADLVLLDELDVRRLQRRIARLDGGHDALGFDQSDCFTVCHKLSPANYFCFKTSTVCLATINSSLVG